MTEDQRKAIDSACDGGRLLPVAEYLRHALILDRAILAELTALRAAMQPPAPAPAPKPTPAPVATKKPATKRRRTRTRTTTSKG